MTVIMVWRSAADDTVWLASDSRISSSAESGGQTVYTDHAAKILPIPVHTLLQSPEHVPGIPLPAPAIGLAYAGSSLIALETYAAVLPLWSRILVPSTGAFPSMEQFAEHFSRFFASYARDVSSQSGRPQGCTCVLIGFDREQQKIEGWNIFPEIIDGSVVATKKKMSLESGEVELFGTGADEARNKLPIREDMGREPLRMIRECLPDGLGQSVGGGVQIGYVNAGGFQLTYDLQLSRVESSVPELRYRGFNFADCSAIGSAIAALPGMA